MKLSPPNQELLTSLIVTPLIPPPKAPSYTPEVIFDEHQQQDQNGGHSPRQEGGGREHRDYSPRHEPSPRQRYQEQDHQGEEEEEEEEDHRPVRSSSKKWTRGQPVPAVVVVVSLAVEGIGLTGREGLRIRAAAANLFQVSFSLFTLLLLQQRQL